MNYYALEYDTVDRFVERRAFCRPEHLRLVHEAHQRGEIVLAGALGDPPDGALLIFRSDSSEVAEKFAASDPYVGHGLVLRWRVRPWHLAVGGEA